MDLDKFSFRMSYGCCSRGRGKKAVHGEQDRFYKAKRLASIPLFVTDGLKFYTKARRELSRIQWDGFLSHISSDVEQIKGSKPISFAQFAKDYAKAFQ